MPFLPFPDHAPEPVLATFTVAVAVIVFDQALEAGPLLTGNWSVRRSGMLYPVSGAHASGDAVSLTLGSPVVLPGTEGVSYHADPPDLTGENGKDVEPFENFPFAS